jgi:folate-binding protein YgfZ
MSKSDSPAGTPGYVALTSSVAAWVDPDRTLVRVEGPRAAGLLNGLLSADVEALRPGDAALSFILTPKGRPVAVPTVLRLEDAILLDVSRAALSGLLDHFRTYLPPRFASVTVLDDARRVSLLGPHATEAATGLDLAGNPLRVARASEDAGGVDFYLPGDGTDREAIESAAVSLGGAVASPADYETWRIERGISRFGLDITADNLPQETGLVPRAVSFDKGCYTGQEVVARIQYRGHVNRHLRGIRRAESPAGPPLAPGTELTREGKIVGTITSSCASPRFGPIGLAYVRHELFTGDSVDAATDPSSTWLLSDIPFTSP